MQPCSQAELCCHRHCKLQDLDHQQVTVERGRGCGYFDPCSSSETLQSAMGMPLMQGPLVSPQAATAVAVSALHRQQRSSGCPSCPQKGDHHVHQGAMTSSLWWQGPGEHTVQGAKH